MVDTARRPRALPSSKSFSRYESPPRRQSGRTRARTTNEKGILEVTRVDTSPEDTRTRRTGDLFETREDESEEEPQRVEHDTNIVPHGFEELPVEIRSLCDKFIRSLSAKVHPIPMSIDKLAQLFQEFYVRAETVIDVHLTTFATGPDVQKSQTTSTPSQMLASGKKGGRESYISSESEMTAERQAHQMLTASEIVSKRRARRHLENRRVVLEEAVERVVCERVYDSIWRHRSTDDAERDDKLRSRAAALLLVGIGLRDLKVDVGQSTSNADGEVQFVEREAAVRESLQGARSSLARMNEETYPVGKLNHLTSAHKSIVDTLSQYFASTSSADEILPTFIYTLITSPPEGTNIISNLQFIQRFRNQNKIDGEAAWCITNAEAAISFLESVDLASLRAEEAMDRKYSKNAGTPVTEKSNPLGPPGSVSASAPTRPSLSVEPAKSGELSSGTASKPLSSVLPQTAITPGHSRPTTPNSHRRISNLLQEKKSQFEATANAVQRSADEAFDTINATLENSFNILFGRLREQQAAQSSGNDSSSVIVPKTLEDARKLVSSPTPSDDEEKDVASLRSSIFDEPGADTPPAGRADSKLLDLIGGRPNTITTGRDRSVDSTKSGGSGRRVAFAKPNEDPLTSTSHVPVKERPKPVVSLSKENTPSPQTQPTAFESMKNLGNSINPLNRFAGMGMIRSFSRSGSGSTVPTPTSVISEQKQATEMPSDSSAVTTLKLSGAFTEADIVAAKRVLETLKRTAPPIKSLIDTKDPGDLRISDVESLLRDYQRLARALADVGVYVLERGDS